MYVTGEVYVSFQLLASFCISKNNLVLLPGIKGIIRLICFQFERMQ